MPRGRKPKRTFLVFFEKNEPVVTNDVDLVVETRRAEKKSTAITSAYIVKNTYKVKKDIVEKGQSKPLPSMTVWMEGLTTVMPASTTTLKNGQIVYEVEPCEIVVTLEELSAKKQKSPRPFKPKTLKTQATPSTKAAPEPSLT